MTNDRVKEVAKELVNLTVAEVRDLENFLKEEYGIEPQMFSPSISEMSNVSNGSNTENTQDKLYTVMLKNAGTSKLSVIKLIRDLLNLDLKDAKNLVDGAPKAIKENISSAEAEDIKNKLVEAGAEVELK